MLEPRGDRLPARRDRSIYLAPKLDLGAPVVERLHVKSESAMHDGCDVVEQSLSRRLSILKRNPERLLADLERRHSLSLDRRRRALRLEGYRSGLAASLRFPKNSDPAGRPHFLALGRSAHSRRRPGDPVARRFTRVAAPGLVLWLRPNVW